MMKLGQWGRRFLVPRMFSDDSTAAAATRVLFFSTETLTASSSSRSWSCFEKSVSHIKDPKVSIIPYLNEWIEKGAKYDEFQLSKLADRMHQHKRYQHAFEVSRWMGDPAESTALLTPEEISVRLDLIYKVRGLEHAERYFNSIPLFLQPTTAPCRSLLNCYVEEKSVEKAETFVHKMEKLGLVRTLSFNHMLSILYLEFGQHQKENTLFLELMESNDILSDEVTMIDELIISTWDVVWMEKIHDQMDKDPEFYVDWTVYAIMADGYLKAGPGLIDKALKMMKKVEKMTIIPEASLVLELLLTLYTRVGKKEELYRLWNLHKSSSESGLQSTSYATMITSLSEFDDIEGAEKIFEEWESTGSRVDFRVVLNRLVTAYCKKGHFEKAESVVERVVKNAGDESEQASYAKTWNVLGTGYLREKRMAKAMEMFKKAMLVGRGDWELERSSVVSCVKYFEEKWDIEKEAQEFVKLPGASALLIQELGRRLRVLNRIKESGWLLTSVLSLSRLSRALIPH